ncbi:MAG: AraC family transcriptional regulator [Pseudomonadales bacterium]
MLTAGFSTIGPLGWLIAQTLEAEGIDPAPLFDRAGVDLNTLRDPSVRMPSEVFHLLLEQVELASNDPVFGLTMAKFIHPTTFYSLGIAMYCSETLGGFLDRLAKYYRLVTTNDEMVVDVQDDCYRLRAVHVNPVEFSPVREDGIASIVVKIIRVALHDHYEPKEVALRRSHPGEEAGEYERFFGCKVTFDAPYTEILLPVEDVARKLPSANPVLSEMYEQLTVEYLKKIDRIDFPARVRKELVWLLPSGVSSKEQVASALNMSTRTLYNKLEQSGTTFREVLDDTRHTLADQYFRQELPIYEIAYLIGFSDTANFSRAFKKWTGVSPNDYRQQISKV